jgi:hypothetical protein
MPAALKTAIGDRVAHSAAAPMDLSDPTRLRGCR